MDCYMECSRSTISSRPHELPPGGQTAHRDEIGPEKDIEYWPVMQNWPCRTTRDHDHSALTAVLEVRLAAVHQAAKALEVVGADHGAQALDGVEQGGERLGAVVVEGLDLEVE